MNNPLITAELLKPEGVCARLSAARTAANLQGKELAQRAGWRPTKVSKLELGQQMPTADDVHTWLRVCGQNGQTIREVVELLDEIRHAYPELQRIRRSAVRSERAEVRGAPETLQEAYDRGYVDAIRDMTSSLGQLREARREGR